MHYHAGPFMFTPVSPQNDWYTVKECKTLPHLTSLMKIKLQSLRLLVLYISRHQIFLINKIIHDWTFLHTWPHATPKYCGKLPKFSDGRKLRCNLPKIQTKRPNLWVFLQKDANWIANSEDPDQTAPLADQSVRKLRIITVSHLFILQYFDHS